MAPHNDTTLAALPGETGESCAIEERHSGESCAIEERHSVAHRPEQVIEPAVVHAKRQLILLRAWHERLVRTTECKEGVSHATRISSTICALQLLPGHFTKLRGYLASVYALPWHFSEPRMVHHLCAGGPLCRLRIEQTIAQLQQLGRHLRHLKLPRGVCGDPFEDNRVLRIGGAPGRFSGCQLEEQRTH
eukprot:4233205-Prymnesium_polylepis.1